MKHRKIVLLKDASVDGNGRLEGYAAVYGNIDDGGDMILQGALKNAIPRFLKEGFISWGHDWNTPIAMPKAAHEDANGLFIAADFHSTPTAQEKRTITMERLAAGLSMGLSIGYGDVKSRRMPHYNELTQIDRLFETGIVTVPMNTMAGVASAKSLKAAADDVAQATWALNAINQLLENESADAAEPDADPGDAEEVNALISARDSLLRFLNLESAEVGTADDLADAAVEDACMPMYMGRTYANDADAVERALKALVKRSRSVARPRKEGRVLSASNRTRLESLIEALAAAQSDLTDLLASADPSSDKGLAIAALAARARSLGVPLV